MKLCKSCGRPVLESGVCVCKYKVVGTWGPWKTTTKVSWPLKKTARQAKCQAAVDAARRRVGHDEEFLQGGEEPHEEEPYDYE